MNILMVAPLKRGVSAEITASRSRVIYDIASELAKLGHSISLLGTGDSKIPEIKLIPIIPKSFTQLPPFENQFYAEAGYLVQLTKKIIAIGDKFDIVHNHTYPEFINLFAGERIKTPMITTIHAQATAELDETLSLFPQAHFVAISNSQKLAFKKTQISTTIYNGIDVVKYPFFPKKEDYLLWIGRVSNAKNQDGTFVDPKGIKWAIRLAQSTGSNLLLSGSVEDLQFFETEIKPALSDKIRWVGHVGSEQPLSRLEVVALMQRTKAFLMTINWEEPFGLVMAEAMSCGTPVIAFNRGAASEIVIDGKTGFLVDPTRGVEGLQEALSKINTINPEDCRKHVEENFSIQRMVSDYEKLYKKLASGVE